MRIETRYRQVAGHKVVRGLVLIAECNEESTMIDEAFGKKVVDNDGLIADALVRVQVRLSDGCFDHYIYLEAPHEGQRSQDRTDHGVWSGWPTPEQDSLVHSIDAFAYWNPGDTGRPEPALELAAG